MCIRDRFTHIANYLPRTLSQQTNAHSEYNTCNVNYKIANRLYISVSSNQQMFHLNFQSHHSNFVVILSCLRRIYRLHRQVVFWKLPKQLLDNILFLAFYTGLFLLFRKKNWGGTAPRPLPLLRHCIINWFCRVKASSFCPKTLCWKDNRPRPATVFSFIFPQLVIYHQLLILPRRPNLWVLLNRTRSSENFYIQTGRITIPLSKPSFFNVIIMITDR